jgi:hypothetical protein
MIAAGRPSRNRKHRLSRHNNLGPLRAALMAAQQPAIPTDDQHITGYFLFLAVADRIRPIRRVTLFSQIIMPVSQLFSSCIYIYFIPSSVIVLLYL